MCVRERERKRERENDLRERYSPEGLVLLQVLFQEEARSMGAQDPDRRAGQRLGEELTGDGAHLRWAQNKDFSRMSR